MSDANEFENLGRGLIFRFVSGQEEEQAAGDERVDQGVAPADSINEPNIQTRMCMSGSLAGPVQDVQPTESTSNNCIAPPGHAARGRRQGTRLVIGCGLGADKTGFSGDPDATRTASLACEPPVLTGVHLGRR